MDQIQDQYRVVLQRVQFEMDLKEIQSGKEQSSVKKSIFGSFIEMNSKFKNIIYESEFYDGFQNIGDYLKPEIFQSTSF